MSDRTANMDSYANPRARAIVLWTLLDCGLALATAPLPKVLGSHYGTEAEYRAAGGLVTVQTAQLAFLLWSLRRAEARGRLRAPDVADALTLSRAHAAAILATVVLSGIRDRTGTAGRIAWSALLWGETVSDWLDGAIARRRGGTELGAMLDLEADSWLTLWAALAAVRWGEAPRSCALAPALRYTLPLLAARNDPGCSLGTAMAGAWWARATGVAQMGVISAALCPWPARPMRLLLRAAPAVAAASLFCFASQGYAQWTRKGREMGGQQSHEHRCPANPVHPVDVYGR